MPDLDLWNQPDDRVALELKLRDPAVATTADVLAYLEAQDRSDMLPSQFFTDADLDHYRAACAWWPEHVDMPLRLQKPDLLTLCMLYAEPWAEGTVNTFHERLNWLAVQTDAWFKQHGPKRRGAPRLYPLLPGETEAERLKRLDRMRQERYKHGATAHIANNVHSNPELRVLQGELKAAQLAKRDDMLVHDQKINAIRLQILNIQTAAKKAAQ